MARASRSAGCEIRGADGADPAGMHRKNTFCSNAPARLPGLNPLAGASKVEVFRSVGTFHRPAGRPRGDPPVFPRGFSTSLNHPRGVGLQRSIAGFAVAGGAFFLKKSTFF